MSATTLTHHVASTEAAIEWIEETHDWLLERVEGNDVSITIPVSGTCDPFARVDVSESDDSVTLEVIVEAAAGRSVVCWDMIQFEEVTVTLSEPLAGRPLHGCLLDEDGTYFDSTHGVDRDNCSDKR